MRLNRKQLKMPGQIMKLYNSFRVEQCFIRRFQEVFSVFSNWTTFCIHSFFPPSCAIAFCHQILEKEQHGPICRNGMNAVSICTATLLEEVLRNDDKFPKRGDMSIWKEYRDLRGYGYGLFTESDSRWCTLVNCAACPVFNLDWHLSSLFTTPN